MASSSPAAPFPPSPAAPSPPSPAPSITPASTPLPFDGMSSSDQGSDRKFDEEKGVKVSPVVGSATGVIHANDGVNREKGFVGKLWKIAEKLDSYGVEVRGIERVPEEERHPHHGVWSIGALWASANYTVSTFALGALGASIWRMGLIDSCLTILFFNLICTIPLALFSSWGMQTGLRQMVIGRYSFGSVGIYFPVVLNCIACIGWSTINTIVGAQALVAVSSTHQLPVAAGVVIIALLTLVVALFGYRHVHMFERYASIPIIIIFFIMLGQAAPHISTSMGPAGEAGAANVLSFGAAIAGFALGWASLAADYTVNFPADTPPYRIFGWTYLGAAVPMILIECLGAAMMTTFESKTTWKDAYDRNGLGGLLGAPLSPMRGFGSLLLVILALSIVANSVPNSYSFALTFQAFGRYAQAIPRFFLVIVATAIYIVLAIVGASNFEAWLHTLLILLGYWLAIYVTILIEEHYIFRGGSFSRYNLEAYNTNELLPKGYAALATCAIGIAGAVLGMSQVWYVGVVGGLIADPKYGADIGFEMSGGFAAISYPVFRYLELKYVGR